MRKDRENEDYHPEMPPLEAGSYLVGFLFEIGPTLSGGMGPSPLTHAEIEAWQRNVGLTLQPFEARWLRRLSIEYLNESHLAEKSDCPAPWRPKDQVLEESDRRAAARRIQESIRALTKL